MKESLQTTRVRLANDVAARRAAFWLQLFLVNLIACQIALLVESLAEFRVVFRSLAFGMSLCLLLLPSQMFKPHPAKVWGVASLAVLTLGLLHPGSSTPLASAAHIGLSLAIIAPLFWGTRLRVTPQLLTRLVIILWAFHTLSAGLGVLQSYYPGRFQPSVSTVITGMGEMADAYKIVLADGQYVWRPMGLTDTPGGAASAGMYAVIFGLGLLLRVRSAGLRLLSVGGLFVGFYCLYICQVRSLLVMSLICCAAMLAVTLNRGQRAKAVTLGGVLALALAASFSWATLVGGESTTQRVTSLVDESPDEVYYSSRGHFLEDTFTAKILEYPLGAGLARWGMMRGYFGDPGRDPPSIWVEIQWTAWVLDGGIPLMIAYVAAIVVTLRVSLRIARSRLPGGVPEWGTLIFAYSIGAVAVTFNYPMFMSQGGMMFWFLNAVLFAAAVQASRTAQEKAR